MWRLQTLHETNWEWIDDAGTTGPVTLLLGELTTNLAVFSINDCSFAGCMSWEYSCKVTSTQSRWDKIKKLQPCLGGWSYRPAATLLLSLPCTSSATLNVFFSSLNASNTLQRQPARVPSWTEWPAGQKALDLILDLMKEWWEKKRKSLH